MAPYCSLVKQLYLASKCLCKILPMLTLSLFFILLGNTLIHHYVLFRQYKVMTKPQTSQAKKIFTDREYKDSVAYGKARNIFQMVVTAFEFLKDVAIVHFMTLFYGKYFKGHRYSNELLVVTYVLFNTLVLLPFDAFSDFVIERKFGFNKKSVKTFVSDAILSASLTSCITFVVCYVLFRIVERFEVFYVYAWIFMCLFVLFMNILAPKFIAPLFNTFEPLPENSLKQEIHKLADRIGFKIDKIMVMDGSRRTGHANAYFTGLGPVKKIVLYDTILNTLEGNNREILAVLCHEFGHWAKSHIIVNMVIGFATTFVYLYSFNWCVLASPGHPIGLQIIRFMYLLAGPFILVTLASNVASRMMERQADAFAVQHGYGAELKEALSKLAKGSKGTQIVDPLYSAMKYTHPPILERLEYIDSITSKND